MSKVVQAAGGVVAREGAAGAHEVLLVHRPRYDDWSLPKGKLDQHEYPLVAAVREVHEETAVLAVPQVRLPGARYLTGVPGVEKAVEYWSMVARASTGFVPNDEVDEVRWVPVREAVELLTYGHDRGVLQAYEALPAVTTTVLLVRHASAGESASFGGPDEQRPLDFHGEAQAEALTPVLNLFQPQQLISATPVRCVETLQPLARALALPVGTDAAFDEGADPAAAAEVLRQFAVSGRTTVVSSQGKLIPPVLAMLGGRDSSVYHTPKGGLWSLAFNGTELVAASRLEPPA